MSDMLIRTLIILAVLIVIVVLIVAIGFWTSQRERAAFINEHITGPTQAVTIDLRPDVYADLPAPVRRYFDFAFNCQTEITVHWVEWIERGDFLLPVGQFTARGRQASRPDAPIHAWTGTFHRWGLPMLESRDAFLLAGHDMRAKLFGWLKVMHTDYEDPTEVALLHSYLVLRYFGQAPMMPWALLPNPYVQWQPRDDNSAWLVITREGLEGLYLVTFSDDGRITQMETDRLLQAVNPSHTAHSTRCFRTRSISARSPIVVRSMAVSMIASSMMHCGSRFNLNWPTTAPTESWASTPKNPAFWPASSMMPMVI